MFANRDNKAKKQTVVPKLNLQNLGSNSAPNSARSNKKVHGGSSAKLNENEEKYLAWKKRKEYKPTLARKKNTLRMTKSLTVDSAMCLPIDENEEYEFDAKKVNDEGSQNLTELDELVIDTTLNISNKLCLSAGQVLTKTTQQFSVNDGQLLEEAEILSYVLEDTHLTVEDTSHQLSSILRNLKKLEHSLELTHSMVAQHNQL